MFKKILIANRGEIAVRIIRACRELGIATIAVVSEADRDCLHSLIADETVCVGPAPSGESYLNMQNIISAALTHGADAIHPGFGFLSESADFADICRRCGIEFIGPDAQSIRLLGDKSAAKATAKANGVPTIPGSDGELDSFEDVLRVAKETGFPLLIKASAGGGGRGIRLVETLEELENAYHSAKAEAETCFGYSGVYIEKYLSETRHVEFQIMADAYGNTVHLGERDCSMQRRKQKILEESPCTAITPALREKMGAMAIKAAKAVHYKNTGTVEFLLDKDGNFYFMEMNTRIQVEHPVTEMVTRLDLVKEQIRIAAGEKLSFTQQEAQIMGHAIECRINAESPKHQFAPRSGTVDALHIPGGNNVRFDSHLYEGYKMPVNYDSMLGKLIVWGRSRDEAIAKMKSALNEMIIDGIETNVEFQLYLLENKDFRSGNYHTGTVERILAAER